MGVLSSVGKGAKSFGDALVDTVKESPLEAAISPIMTQFSASGNLISEGLSEDELVLDPIENTSEDLQEEADTALEDEKEALEEKAKEQEVIRQEKLAKARVIRERMIETLKGRQKFEEAQMIKWEQTFGGIQQNLSEFYNTLTPEQLSSQRISKQKQQYIASLEAMQRNAAQRGLDVPATALLETTMQINAAEQQARIRNQSPFDLAQAQGQFVSTSKVNPFASRVSTAIGGVAQGEAMQASDFVNEAQSSQSIAQSFLNQQGSLIGLGIQNKFNRAGVASANEAADRRFQQQLQQDAANRKRKGNLDILKLGAYAAGSYFGGPVGGAAANLAVDRAGSSRTADPHTAYYAGDPHEAYYAE